MSCCASAIRCRSSCSRCSFVSAGGVISSFSRPVCCFSLLRLIFAIVVLADIDILHLNQRLLFRRLWIVGRVKKLDQPLSVQHDRLETADADKAVDDKVDALKELRFEELE